MVQTIDLCCIFIGMNKDVMMDLVTKHGIQVAKTWKVKVGEIPEEIEYPIMTKAINSIGKEWNSFRLTHFHLSHCLHI